MLTITNKDNCEPLTKIQNVEINEEVNGEFKLSFTSILHVENIGHNLIEEEAVVEHDGYEFKIVDVNENQYSKSVTAIHTFFNLSKKWKHDINGGTKTVSNVADWLLEGTGWTWEVQGTIPPQVLENFGNSNVVNLIRHMCEELKCEVKIMPNNHLLFAMEIGSDNDFQFRFKHNTKTLKRSVNTNDLATVIKGKGGNGLEVTYASPNVSIYGELEAEPISDERFTSAESLTNYIKDQLKDTPEVSIDIELTELQKDEFELGETVWVIYEPMNIEFQTRIMKYKKFPFSRKSPVVTLSNVAKTLTDQLVSQQVEIDENKKEYRSKFDQTNERITLSVERIDGDIVDAMSLIQLNADQILLRVTETRLEEGLLEAVTDANAYTDATELNITNDYKAYTDGLLATVDTRLTLAEASITLNADKINLKVDSTVYESGIADSKSYAEIKALEAKDAAELYASAQSELAQAEAEAYADGIVTAEEQARIDDAIAKLAEAKAHAELKATEAHNAANGYTDGAIAPVVTRITDAESSITQLSNDITLKVSEDVYLVDKNIINGNISSLDGSVSSLGTRMSSAESSISIQAGQISSKVSTTDYNGTTITSKINQSSSSVKIDAKNIELNGITQVNQILNVGAPGSNDNNKSIVFNNYAGIETYAGTTSLEITAFGNIYLGGDTIRFDKYTGGTGAIVDLSTARQVIYGDNAPVARFG